MTYLSGSADYTLKKSIFSSIVQLDFFKRVLRFMSTIGAFVNKSKNEHGSLVPFCTIVGVNWLNFVGAALIYVSITAFIYTPQSDKKFFLKVVYLKKDAAHFKNRSIYSYSFFEYCAMKFMVLFASKVI